MWPHDSSIVAAGLARYGFRDEAAMIAAAMFEAAAFFGHRPAPTACSPQAWATAAPLLFLRTILGLEPNGDRLTCDPHLPESIGSLSLTGIRGRWSRAEAVATRETVALTTTA